MKQNSEKKCLSPDMHIVQINTLDIKGGGSKVAYNLHKSWQQRGDTSDIFVCKKFSDDPHVHYIRKDGVVARAIRALTHRDIGRYLREKVNVIFPTDIDFYNMNGLFASDAYRTATVVHCHNLHGRYFNISALPRISREKPLIWTLHDMWPITSHCPHAFDGACVNGFFTCPQLPIFDERLRRNAPYLTHKKRSAYERTRMHIVVPSHWLQAQVQNSVLGNKDIVHIPNGIDTTIFTPGSRAEARTMLGLPTHGRIILFAGYRGSNNPWKGWNFVEDMIARYAQTPDVYFLCVGGNNVRAARTTNSRVLFHPYIDNEHILAQYYRAADCVLFPSIAETFGMVLVEAMACGTPAVSFDVGGTSEIITHNETGYLARYRDPDDLYAGIAAIFSRTQKEIERMRVQAITRAHELFSLTAMSNAYHHLYERAIYEHHQK